MSALDTIEKVAGMLPDDSKQRFLMMCQRFNSVSEDDEFLLLLEAICLNTLLWKEVPEEVSKVMAGASPIPENHAQLKSMIDTAVREAVPSYEDLKQFSGKLEESVLLLKRQPTEVPSNASPLNKKYLFIGILIGCTLPYVLGAIFRL